MGYAKIPGVLIFFILSYLNLFKANIDILIYREFIICIFSVLIHLVILEIYNSKQPLQLENKLSYLSIALSFNLCFLIIFPVTIERSISIFLLEEIEASSSGITEADLKKLLIEDYINNKKAIEKRVYEQVATGNIEIIGQKIILTTQGKIFMKFSKFIRKVFSLDQNSKGIAVRKNY